MASSNYDCVQRHGAIGKLVLRETSVGELKRYYRFRSDRWYGGVFTADCSGCGLNVGSVGYLTKRFIDLTK